MRILYITLLSPLILLGCSAVRQPIDEASQYISGKAAIEQGQAAAKATALIKCQELCQNQIVSDGQDLTSAPCLAEQIAPGWSCDMAHEPRQELDDDPANRCTNAAAGRTKLVEVDGNCNLIKSD